MRGLLDLAPRCRALAMAGLLKLRVRCKAAMARSRVRMFVSPRTRLPRHIGVVVEKGIHADLVIDDDVGLERGAALVLREGTLIVGRGSRIGPRVRLEGGRALVLDPGARVGLGSRIAAKGVVAIGHDATLDEYVSVTGAADGTVHVGLGAHVGAHARLMPSASVADGADVAPHDIVADAVGSPAQVPEASGAAPDVSVVVSTRNRAALLPRLIEALRAQTLPPERFEVVVVDDGSSDGTATLLERESSTGPFTMRILRNPATLGPAAGRDRGWRAADGATIAFTDDDCIPSRDWLARGLLALETGLDFVQGRTVPVPREMVHKRSFADSQTILRASVFFQTCNMLYRREVLESIGGFDETFRHCGEDADLGWRARKGGFRGDFAREVLVEHVVHRRGPLAHLRAFWKFRDGALVPKRHPESRTGYAFRCFFRRAHAWLLLGIAGGVTGWLVTPWAYLACIPYASVLFSFGIESTALPIRILTWPAKALTDAAEIVVLIIGTVRHRSVLL